MGRFIEINDIRIEVIRNRRQKMLRLRIEPKTGQPQLSIPWFCPIFTAKGFVKKHLIWIKKNMEQIPQKHIFAPQMHISFLGKELTLVHQTTSKRGTYIDGNCLIVGGELPFFHRRVKDFIKGQLKLYVWDKAQTFATSQGKKIKSVTIRDTFSRWGSCSSAGGLSFSWRLALSPQFVLDYVIAHEVSHLVYMDHSVFFWKTVKSMHPNVAQAKKWLKDNGKFLHSFQ